MNYVTIGIKVSATLNLTLVGVVNFSCFPYKEKAPAPNCVRGWLSVSAGLRPAGGRVVSVHCVGCNPYCLTIHSITNTYFICIFVPIYRALLSLLTYLFTYWLITYLFTYLFVTYLLITYLLTHLLSTYLLITYLLTYYLFTHYLFI